MHGTKELHALGVPVPCIIKHGKHGDMFYNLISFINGKDLGEVYHTLMCCIDFMGEQGMQFNNDIIIPVNKEKVDLLNTIYKDLINAL